MHQGRGAPPLVFVHGFLCSRADWHHQIHYFSETHEVVACDLRGHGETPGQPHECSIEHFGGDVVALANNLELPPFILIGHSMGCRVVLEANRIAPERVAGIVLIDGSRVGSGDPDGAEAAASAQIEQNGYQAWAQDLFRQMFFKSTPASERLVQRAVRQSAETGAALWPRLARWDAATLEPALAAVRAPVLVIQSTTRDAQGQRAPMQPGQSSPWLDLLKERLNRVKIEVLPGLGHFAQLEASERVNRLIAEFCR
ncbi:MAG TPA: alpha/beta hydrolase [Burkholderiales bacterium]|nr:alpha/beta hydrolase [Burkholderiales bacterium]